MVDVQLEEARVVVLVGNLLVLVALFPDHHDGVPLLVHLVFLNLLFVVHPFFVDFHLFRGLIFVLEVDDVCVAVVVDHCHLLPVGLACVQARHLVLNLGKTFLKEDNFCL